MYERNQLQWLDVICEHYIYCRIRLEGLLYDVEHDLLAIAKYFFKLYCYFC